MTSTIGLIRHRVADFDAWKETYDGFAPIQAEHGTMFVGFSADQKRLSDMLDSMAGLVDGKRDALTRYTHPLTGAYYFVPAADSLRWFIPDEDSAG